MRMRSVDTVWIPHRRNPLLVLAAVLASLALVVGIVVAVRYLANDVMACSPPSQQEQEVQEAFVRSRVADAQDLNWIISDCDDDGTGYLSFTTALAPAAARDAFLTDTSCAPYREQGAGDNAVTCKCTADQGWSASKIELTACEDNYKVKFFDKSGKEVNTKRDAYLIVQTLVAKKTGDRWKTDSQTSRPVQTFDNEAGCS